MVDQKRMSGGRGWTRDVCLGIEGGTGDVGLGLDLKLTKRRE